MDFGDVDLMGDTAKAEPTRAVVGAALAVLIIPSIDEVLLSF